jgi:carbamoylphosphate synthase large subunit
MQKSIFFPVTNSGGSNYKIQAFQAIGWRVIAGDANPNAVGRFTADAFYQVPWQSDPDYFTRIFEIIKNEKVDVYVSAGEKEALQVSRMRDDFLAIGCTPTAADTHTLELAIDKCALFTFLQEKTDIPLPLFRTIETEEDFNEGLKALDGTRVCMKPASTSGSRGFVLIGEETPPAKVFNHRITYMTVSPDFVRRGFAEGVIPKMILMEYLDAGDNVNASIIAKEGKLIFSSVHTRENMAAGLSTGGSIIQNEEIVEINREIAKAVGTTGFIMSQFIGNKLIEINPRWSTSIIYKSVNEYLMGIKVWTGEEITIDAQDVAYHQHLTYKRYYEQMIYDDGGNIVDVGASAG